MLPTGVGGVPCAGGGHGGAAAGSSGGAAASRGGAAGESGQSGNGGSATGGAAAAGGSSETALCPDGVTPFGVCFVSDADQFPLPPTAQDAGVRSMGAATIQAVGVGPAPTPCESGRVFATRRTSDWWFQAKAADGRSWTIGMYGLGKVPLVKKGDQVTLDLFWAGYLPAVGFGPPEGELHLSDANGTPLLWAGASNGGFMTTWMWLGEGDPVCGFPADSCDITRFSVAGAIDGTAFRMPPFSTAYVGSYFVAAGQPVRYVVSDTRCMNDLGPGFAAAVSRVPPSATSPSP